MVMSKEELSRLDVSTKQQRIARIARQKSEEPLTLLNHYMDESWLMAAYGELRKESAPGIDEQTVKGYFNGIEEKLKRLLELAKSGKYKAPPVKRVEIPKPGSKEFRPIGIPTTEDKLLQKAVQMLLEPIYEQEFYEFSFGFRPGKSQHQALDYMWKKIMGNNIRWVIDLDIRKFFDTVKHDILHQLLSIRVRDGVILRLIGKWLNAGVMKNRDISYPEEGTPQGGVISPLISNIYLHEALDKWYAKEIRPHLKGRSFMIRFADDAILGFENQEEAEYVMKALKGRLAGYGLELHPEKTRLVYFDKPNSNKTGHPKPGSFDFLGFTHYWDKSLKGNWIVKRKTSKKKFKEKLKNIKQWCKENRHMPMKEQHEKLCRKIKGHYGYYGITGNARSLSQYRYEVTRTWKKWLCRRSKRGYRLNWDRFNKLMDEFFPLPPIKVVHSIYRAAKP
jgi:RNA-directed DNA polymerase